MLDTEGITFDDVLLVPQRSSIRSRKTVDTSTKLSRDIDLAVPIVSSSMDTVTEHEMAITMARAGGIGVVHRFMPIQQQIEEVAKVKRSESILIEQPYTISARETLAQARERMKRYDVSGFLVVDATGKLDGILTARDILFADGPQTPVSELMTKRSELVTAPVGTSIEEAERILREHKLEKLPIVDAKGILKGLITSKDIVTRREYPDATKDSKGRLRVAAAIGARGDYLARARALVDAGVDVLVVDVANGHSELTLDAVRALKKEFRQPDIIAGNVATAEGAKDLIDAGVDSVKVGIGSGSICITRLVAGAGVPQLTAIMDCAKVAGEAGISIIADGGIRNAGDVTKALAAGGSSVMVGNLLAGTDESPGFTFIREGAKFKMIRGMASFGATVDRQLREKIGIEEEELEELVPEGVEALVPYRGKASEIVAQLVGGLRSGMSYCGARNIAELQRNAVFVRISEASKKESEPHDVEGA
jgi:IMP dehydrogenase